MLVMREWVARGITPKEVEWRRPLLWLVASPRRMWHVALGALFALALAVRWAYNLTVARDYVPQHDAAIYVALARHIVRWGCYCVDAPGQPTTYRPPVFPLFLAGVNLLGGTSSLAMRLALSVVGALTCVVVALIARELFGARVGLLAGLIAATYPQLFLFDAWLYSESLAIFLFALSCYAVMRVVHQPVGWRWALVGVLLGVTCLARPNGVYAVGAVVVWALIAIRARLIAPRQALLGTALLVGACAAVLAPWTLRNAIVTRGAFVPITTGMGDVVAGAYNDQAYSKPGVQGLWVNPWTWATPSWTPQERALLDPFRGPCWGACEVRRDHATTTVGLMWARAHPGELPALVLLRLRALFTPASPPAEAGMPVWRPFATWYPALVLLLAILGAVALWRRWREALLPALFGATVILSAVVFYGSPRMRAPMEPILVALAAGGAVWCARLARASMKGRAPLQTSRLIRGTMRRLVWRPDRSELDRHASRTGGATPRENP
jgi:4-amino-4-deoxy-L-arabinose transferase-like glycosyltransferase